MLRKIICVALALGAAATANPLPAETPGFEGPPPWRDSASVYLNLDQAASIAGALASTGPVGPAPPVANVDDRNKSPQPTTAPLQVAPTPPPFVDPAVQHAFHQPSAAADANDTQRLLAPPSAAAPIAPSQVTTGPVPRPFRSFAFPLESVSTTLAALSVVVGCFLICTWLVRRGSRKSTAALPRDVVSVLGRVPLAARNVAQLLRVGNKLVLISLTPAGAETLTEITDPAEVDRLVGLCHQSDPHSTTKAFEHVFRQMSLEPTPDGFLGKEPSFAAAYRGGAVRG